MPIEIEKKLLARPEQLPKIRAWFEQAGERELDWLSKKLGNTYYDTEHLKLREMNIGFRVRTIDSEYIQSVKSAGRMVGGLFQRNESETLIPSPNFDLSKVEDPYLQILLEEAEEEDGALKPLFKTDFERQFVSMDYEGAEIEIALDCGEIGHRGMKLPICEVELELKSGDPKALFDLSQALIEQFELVISAESKAELGYRLSGHERPELTAGPQLNVVPLTATSGAESSFETIAHQGFDHWQRYIKRFKYKPSVEQVLQLDRALRYMHHLYAVFAPVIPRHSLSEVRADWREITTNFGQIKTVAQKLSWLGSCKERGFDSPELEALEQQLMQKFEQECTVFTQFLSTPIYNLKLLHFSRWLYLKEWRDTLDDGQIQRLDKEIFPFAIKQLQHQLLDLSRHFNVKKKMSEQKYLQFLPKLYRTLDIGLFFGSLFETQKRLKYRKNWMDLVEKIEYFKQLEYLRKALAKQNKSDQLLELTESDILDSLAELRKVSFEQNPYWN